MTALHDVSASTPHQIRRPSTRQSKQAMANFENPEVNSNGGAVGLQISAVDGREKRVSFGTTNYPAATVTAKNFFHSTSNSTAVSTCDSATIPATIQSLSASATMAAEAALLCQGEVELPCTAELGNHFMQLLLEASDCDNEHKQQSRNSSNSRSSSSSSSSSKSYKQQQRQQQQQR